MLQQNSSLHQQNHAKHKKMFKHTYKINAGLIRLICYAILALLNPFLSPFLSPMAPKLIAKDIAAEKLDLPEAELKKAETELIKLLQEKKQVLVDDASDSLKKNLKDLVKNIPDTLNPKIPEDSEDPELDKLQSINAKLENSIALLEKIHKIQKLKRDEKTNAGNRKLSDIRQEIELLNAEKELDDTRTQVDAQKQIQKLERENKKIQAEISNIEKKLALADAKQKLELNDQNLELAQLNLSADLTNAKQEAEMSAEKLKLAKLQHQKELANAEQEAELSAEKLKLAKLQHQKELANAEQEAKLSKEKLELALLQHKKNIFEAETNLIKAEEIAKNKDQLAKSGAEQSAQKINVELANAKLALATAAYKEQELDWTERVKKLEMDMSYKEHFLASNEYTEKPTATYLEEPLRGDTLVISDRRIPFNGLVSADSADYVVDRIHYFNNKNENYPIFIVMDYNFGGSVLAGYKILKAMRASKAPVYVVVKSFAASMAAAITTLAEKSFAFPNAIILHHQVSSLTMGNLTQTKEHLDFLQKIWRRLAEPIADKMGITTDEFIKKMYANNSEGDWIEFGDKADEVKWVTHTIRNIEETKFVKNPDFHGFGKDKNRSQIVNGVVPIRSLGERLGLEEKIDDSGKPYVILPRSLPTDFYYIYNRNNYFRMR